MLSPDTISVQNYQTIQTAYAVGKTVVGLGGLIVGGYKVVQWFKELRTQDLKQLHDGVARVEVGMKEQTAALVGELRELRSDFRTFYIPQGVQKKAPPRKALKKTPKKAPKAKAPKAKAKKAA